MKLSCQFWGPLLAAAHISLPLVAAGLLQRPLPCIPPHLHLGADLVHLPPWRCCPHPGAAYLGFKGLLFVGAALLAAFPQLQALLDNAVQAHREKHQQPAAKPGGQQQQQQQQHA